MLRRSSVLGISGEQRHRRRLSAKKGVKGETAGQADFVVPYSATWRHAKAREDGGREVDRVADAVQSAYWGGALGAPSRESGEKKSADSPPRLAEDVNVATPRRTKTRGSVKRKKGIQRVEAEADDLARIRPPPPPPGGMA
ncbi:hypothetical protein MRX96_049817 [Rhipicephalus microplus]